MEKAAQGSCGIPLWRRLKSTWPRSSVTCCKWPCLVREVGLVRLHRCPSKVTILWFSECSQIIFWDSPSFSCHHLACYEVCQYSECGFNYLWPWLWSTSCTNYVMLDIEDLGSGKPHGIESTWNCPLEYTVIRRKALRLKMSGEERMDI